MASKTVYLIDTENVGIIWKELLTRKSSKDRIVLFFTDKSPHISYVDLEFICQHPDTFEMIQCYTGKNGLDFQLVSYLGFLLKSSSKTEYIIVSNDCGFDSVIKFWTDREAAVSRKTVSDLKKSFQKKPAEITQAGTSSPFAPADEQKEEQAQKQQDIKQEPAEITSEKLSEGQGVKKPDMPSKKQNDGKSGKQPQNQSGKRPQTQQGKQAEIPSDKQSGMQQNKQPDEQPDKHAGTQQNKQPEVQPDKHAGTQQNKQTEVQPDKHAGTQQNKQTEVQPVQQSKVQTMNQPGTSGRTQPEVQQELTATDHKAEASENVSPKAVAFSTGKLPGKNNAYVSSDKPSAPIAENNIASPAVPAETAEANVDSHPATQPQKAVKEENSKPVIMAVTEYLPSEYSNNSETADSICTILRGNNLSKLQKIYQSFTKKFGHVKGTLLYQAVKPHIKSLYVLMEQQS